MKKALIVFGTTAALLANVMAPTAGFAAAKPNDVSTDAVVTMVDSLRDKGDYYYVYKDVEDIVSKWAYSREEDVPLTYWYKDEDGYKGDIDLEGYSFRGGKVYGIYKGTVKKEIRSH